MSKRRSMVVGALLGFAFVIVVRAFLPPPVAFGLLAAIGATTFVYVIVANARGMVPDDDGR